MFNPVSNNPVYSPRCDLHFVLLLVCGLVISGCTTGPLASLGKSRTQSDSSGSLDQITERILEAEQAEPIPPDEPEIRIPETDRAMVETFEDRSLDVRYTERGVVVTLPDVVFEFGSSRLTRDAHGKLREVADVLLREYDAHWFSN